MLVNQLQEDPLRAIEGLAEMAELHAETVWESLLTFSGVLRHLPWVWVLSYTHNRRRSPVTVSTGRVTEQSTGQVLLYLNMCCH